MDLPGLHSTGCTPVVEKGKDTALRWPSLGAGSGESTRLLQLCRVEEGQCFCVGVHLEEGGSMKRTVGWIVSQILYSFLWTPVKADISWGFFCLHLLAVPSFGLLQHPGQNMQEANK